MRFLHARLAALTEKQLLHFRLPISRSPISEVADVSHTSPWGQDKAIRYSCLNRSGRSLTAFPVDVTREKRYYMGRREVERLGACCVSPMQP